jgi:hypothetical protein
VASVRTQDNELVQIFPLRYDTTCSVWNSGLPTHSLSLTDGVVSTACGWHGSNQL